MKHVLLGASLGWIGCAAYAPTLWLTAVASLVSLCYLWEGVRYSG